MFWANAPSLDMLAQKIDDMLNAKQMLSLNSHKEMSWFWVFEIFFFLSDCDQAFRKGYLHISLIEDRVQT